MSQFTYFQKHGLELREKAGGEYGHCAIDPMDDLQGLVGL